MEFLDGSMRSMAWALSLSHTKEGLDISTGDGGNVAYLAPEGRLCVCQCLCLAIPK